MEKMTKVLTVVAVVAGIILLVPLIWYIYIYGTHIAYSHETWAQFGDFLGGVLSPVYSLLAFLALLFTISLQASQLRQTREDFQKTSTAAQEQIDHLRDSVYKEDIFRIIKAIDDDIEELLQTDVSPPAVYPRALLRHMVHEAHRLRTDPMKAGAYGQFIIAAKDTGSIVESVYSRLITLLSEMQRYLELYGKISDSSGTLVIEYFGHKNAQLMQILIDVGGSENEKAVNFFSRYP